MRRGMVGLDAFRDVEGAGGEVQNLTKEGLRMIRKNVLASEEKADTWSPKFLRTEVAEHISRLASWQTRLEALISDALFLLSAEDKSLMTQLRILNLPARIWIHAVVHLPSSHS